MLTAYLNALLSRHMENKSAAVAVTDSHTVAGDWRNNGRIQGRQNQVEIIRNDYSWKGRNVVIVRGEDCDAIAKIITAALNNAINY